MSSLGVTGQKWIYLDSLSVGTLKGRLSLQRPRESPEDVYVGFKPGKMALDLMMRIEGAQFKLEPFALRHSMLTPPELQKAVRTGADTTRRHDPSSRPPSPVVTTTVDRRHDHHPSS